MNGVDLFIDTNICIYLLNGDVKLANLLQDQNIHISFITEIELYAFHGQTNESEKVLNDFISSVTVFDVTHYIKHRTIHIRKQFKLKLPDSIIAASALTKQLPFITADKNFKKIPELELFLYEHI
ncbi:twitching motility protein PilT [Mucilaginibacter sp. PAMC 26640]|nr:twitching motility protein PilT [Mucilaginibacter sp. PAMC 26640]